MHELTAVRTRPYRSCYPWPLVPSEEEFLGEHLPAFLARAAKTGSKGLKEVDWISGEQALSSRVMFHSNKLPRNQTHKQRSQRKTRSQSHATYLWSETRTSVFGCGPFRAIVRYATPPRLNENV